MKIHPMWQAYPALAADLEATLTLLEAQIRPNSEPVAQAILQLINAGGKLLRPAYMLLFSQFQTPDRTKMIALAAAVESLHTATLVHDDIVDGAATRRGTPTISATFGPDVAVYAGDYLFVVCFKLMAQYASNLRSLQQDGSSMEQLLNGELTQMAKRYNYAITIDDYLQQVSGKTGQLFALACFVGAYESGQSLRFAQAAEKIGENIGIAFQLLDDILDYTSTAVMLGKPVHADLRQGVYSAPLILAMQERRRDFQPLLTPGAEMTDGEIAGVLTLVEETDGIAQARTMAADYTGRALAGLRKLPGGSARNDLIRLTEALLTRTM